MNHGPVTLETVLGEVRAVRRNQDAQSQAIAKLGLKTDYLIDEVRGLADRMRIVERWKVEAERTLVELRLERSSPPLGASDLDFDADDSPSGLHKIVPKERFEAWAAARDRAKDAKSFRKLVGVGWRAATFVACAFALVLGALLVASLYDAAKQHPSLVQPEKP
jgi:hypothetical protein